MNKFYIQIILLFITTLICASSIFAQNNSAGEILISGKILSSDSLTPIPLTHISNKNKTRGTAADINGFFQIKINRQDTLYFTAVGFSDGVLHFPDTSKTNYKNLVVLMNRKTYELQPVDIHAYDIADILNRANEKAPSMYRKDTATVKWEKPKRNETIDMSGGTLNGALTAFANLFNDDYQERKKLKQILEVEEAQKNYEMEKALLEKKYFDFSKSVTGLSEAELNHFIEFSKPDLGYLRVATDYRITERIHEFYRTWKYKYKLNDISLNELLENAKFKK